jgi:trypsin
VPRAISVLVALLSVALPAAVDAQQFGGARRVEVAKAYPFTAVGKWTYGDGGSRGVCTAFLVNNCTLVTAARCGQGKAGSFQFEASDGQRYSVRNVRADHDKENKADAADFDVAFGQIATPRAGQPPPGEKYGRFGFDEVDTVSAIAGFTAHCSYGFSTNEEGKGGRGTLDPDVYVWGPLRRWFPDKVRTDEYFLHMANGVYGASGSPIFRCVPTFSAGKLVGVDVTPPARIVGVFIRLKRDKDGLKFADRLRVEPKDMAWGIGGRQFYPSLADYVKEHPCESLR